MKIRLQLTAIFVALTLAAIFATGPNQSAQTKDTHPETAGERFKNIKVLNDMPADQLGKVMNIMAASLGFNCSGCHVSGGKDFDKDDNPHKAIARKMLAMTFDINKRFFNGRPQVSCNTCHRGGERPVSVPDLSAIEHTELRPKQPDVKPTVDQILANYEKALGGRASIEKITARTITASRVEPDGKTTEPETVVQSPGKIRVETKYDKYTVVEDFDGASVTKMGGGSPIKLKPDEAEQIKREAQLFGGGDLHSVYTKLDYRFLDQVEGKNAYLLIGTLADGSRERLYFDALTGLLIRRVASTPTVLGQFQFQVDYSNYKSFGGVKLPVSTRFAMPGNSWTRRISKVKLK